MTGMIDERVWQITQRNFVLGGWVAVKSMVKGYEHYFTTSLTFLVLSMPVSLTEKNSLSFIHQA